MRVYETIEDVLTVEERRTIIRKHGALRLRLLPDGRTVQGLIRNEKNQYDTRWITLTTLEA